MILNCLSHKFKNINKNIQNLKLELPSSVKHFCNERLINNEQCEHFRDICVSLWCIKFQRLGNAMKKN